MKPSTVDPIALTLSVNVDLNKIALWMGRQLQDEDVLTFLKILDDKMASVDFTDKALTLFGATSVARRARGWFG